MKLYLPLNSVYTHTVLAAIF